MSSGRCDAINNVENFACAMRWYVLMAGDYPRREIINVLMVNGDYKHFSFKSQFVKHKA